MNQLENYIIEAIKNKKGVITFKHLDLANELAEWIEVDCYHDESADLGYQPSESDLTGNIEIDFDHGSVYVEFTCQTCGKTESHGDGEFLSEYAIVLTENGDFTISSIHQSLE